MPREGEEDSQKAEKNAAQKNQCIGVSRGGRSTKIHAVVDALGNPIHVQLSAGNVHDVKVAQELVEAQSSCGQEWLYWPTKLMESGNCGST